MNIQTIRKNDIRTFNLYPGARIQGICDDTITSLFSGPREFEKLTAERQYDAYNLGCLVGLEKEFPIRGIDPSKYFYTPGKKMLKANDLNAQWSTGYKVLPQRVWSGLSTGDFEAIHRAMPFVTANAFALSLCGGNGMPLAKYVPLFNNSTLVLLDANYKNIATAMCHMSSEMAGNTIEMRLTDAREGFGGIPFADNTFNFISMLGNSQFSMSFDDLKRLMKEVSRTVCKGGGVFLIESDSIERYQAVFAGLYRDIPGKDSPKMYQLSPQVFMMKY